VHRIGLGIELDAIAGRDNKIYAEAPTIGSVKYVTVIYNMQIYSLWSFGSIFPPIYIINFYTYFIIINY
jgi:hypothetical protein